MTKIYIDENLAPIIAEGLNILESPNRQGFEVVSIVSVFGSGAKDEDWIPVVGAEGSVVITQDLNIHRTRRQRELLESHGIGIFFITPPSKTGYSYWEQVEQLVKRWTDLKKKCRSKRPFSFRCLPKSKEFEGL